MKTNKNLLFEMLELCEKIKDLQGQMQDINFSYDSLQSFILDRTEALEDKINDVLSFY